MQDQLTLYFHYDPESQGEGAPVHGFIETNPSGDEEWEGSLLMSDSDWQAIGTPDFMRVTVSANTVAGIPEGEFNDVSPAPDVPVLRDPPAPPSPGVHPDAGRH